MGRRRQVESARQVPLVPRREGERRGEAVRRRGPAGRGAPTDLRFPKPEIARFSLPKRP